MDYSMLLGIHNLDQSAKDQVNGFIHLFKVILVYA